MESLEIVYDSEMYKSRPVYSPEIVKEIINFWQKFNQNFVIENNLDIVDVGCGTGQLTNKMVSYAKFLLGTDISESQIKQAETSSFRKNFPKFVVSECYNLPVLDSSVDIITAALCIHWFDLDRFYIEVDRCLKSKGVLAVLTWGEGLFIVDADIEIVKQLNNFVAKEIWFGDQYFGPYFAKAGQWAWNLLPGLKYLYPDTGARKEETMDCKFNLKSYGEFLKSTSMYTAWTKNHPNERDLCDVILEKVLFYLGDPASAMDTEILVRFKVALIMCSKP